MAGAGLRIRFHSTDTCWFNIQNEGAYLAPRTRTDIRCPHACALTSADHVVRSRWQITRLLTPRQRALSVFRIVHDAAFCAGIPVEKRNTNRGLSILHTHIRCTDTHRSLGEVGKKNPKNRNWNWGKPNLGVFSAWRICLQRHYLLQTHGYIVALGTLLLNVAHFEANYRWENNFELCGWHCRHIQPSCLSPFPPLRVCISATKPFCSNKTFGQFICQYNRSEHTLSLKTSISNNPPHTMECSHKS